LSFLSHLKGYGNNPVVSLEPISSPVKTSRTNCRAKAPFTADAASASIDRGGTITRRTVLEKPLEIDAESPGIESGNGNGMVHPWDAPTRRPWVLLFIKKTGEICSNQVFTLSPNL
jgi:hypothetical protein